MGITKAAKFRELTPPKTHFFAFGWANSLGGVIFVSSNDYALSRGDTEEE